MGIPTKTESLKSKHVLITGASRGLGVHLARTMWQHGASLLLIARSEEALLRLRDELIATAKDGQQAHAVAADLSRADAVPTIMDRAHRVWDRLDVLINNAAILGPIGKAWETDWEEWEATLRVNLLSVVDLCRACIPWMTERRQGKIINLSGGGATRPRPHFTAYSAAKAALMRFSETLAHEVVDLGVEVNCVAPGALNSAMVQAILQAGPERAGAKEYAQALERAGKGDLSFQRAADLCVFLASPSSDGITGKLISAVWDPWEDLPKHLGDLRDSDIYTLRRIVPKDRGKRWG